jgi:hypothetical protein
VYFPTSSFCGVKDFLGLLLLHCPWLDGALRSTCRATARHRYLLNHPEFVRTYPDSSDESEIHIFSSQCPPWYALISRSQIRTFIFKTLTHLLDICVRDHRLAITTNVYGLSHSVAMQERYYLFPDTYSEEIKKYCTKALPKTPIDYQHLKASLSYKSLLDVNVDSSSLIDGDELNRAWYRISQCLTTTRSTKHYSPTLSRSQSLETINGCFEASSHQSRSNRLSVLLPPAPIYSHKGVLDELVVSHLSSALEIVTQPPSLVITTKWTASPLLLDQLSSDLEELKLIASK